MEQEKCFFDKSSKSSSSPSSSGSSGARDFSYYAYLEEHINNKAKKLTVDYLKKTTDTRRGGQQNNQQLSEQVFLVYKFIHTPIEAIIAGM